MLKRGVFLALLVALCACSNGGGGSVNPGGGGGPTPTPQPANGIGIALPGGTLGIEKDPVWGTVAGYTQQKGAQVLAFPPGAKIKLTNLSTQNVHTFNVVSISNGPPANFPSNPTLSFTPKGHGQLGPGYASGSLNPGKSVTVTLSKPGTYLIGCAYHYSIGMQDVIQVSASATPGPQATPGTGPNLSSAMQRASYVPVRDQRGRSFSIASLRGSPLAITFVSAHCTDACPLINAQFAQAASLLAKSGSDARLLTVTLDPQHDTMREMAAIARQFGADASRWKVAWGTPASVDALLTAFGVQAIAGKDGYREAHSTFVYVLDADGRPAKTLLASSDLAADVVEALRQ